MVILMKINNKGMTIVEVVLTFALIMVITTGLLIIVVNYRNKVSVSSEKLVMDTFKNNITQDLYNDMLKYGLTEINEYSEANFINVSNEIKSEIRDIPTYNTTASYSATQTGNGSLNITFESLN